MKKIKNNPQASQSDDLKFEKELFYALKYYGYLFPTSVHEVKTFEDHYGNTDVNIPEHLQTLDQIFDSKNQETDELNFDFGLRTAAFTSKKSDQFNFLDENTNEDSEQSDDKQPKV